MNISRNRFNDRASVILIWVSQQSLFVIYYTFIIHSHFICNDIRIRFLILFPKCSHFEGILALTLNKLLYTGWKGSFSKGSKKVRDIKDGQERDFIHNSSFHICCRIFHKSNQFSWLSNLTYFWEYVFLLEVFIPIYISIRWGIYPKRRQWDCVIVYDRIWNPHL